MNNREVRDFGILTRRNRDVLRTRMEIQLESGVSVNLTSAGMGNYVQPLARRYSPCRRTPGYFAMVFNQVRVLTYITAG